MNGDRIRMKELIATPGDVEEVIKLFLGTGHNFRTSHLECEVDGVSQVTTEMI